MEYKSIITEDKNYPRKFIERLNENAPKRLYYNGPLELLDNWTMAFFCTDAAGGTILMEMNQILFVLREYAINYIGSWHSVMETEVFRLGLYQKHNTVTLFTAKGLASETFDKYLLDRFYPPLHEFPERDEFYRRARAGELLILSACEPDETRQKRAHIMTRNWLSCVLSDLVFIPYGPKGSKTYTTAKKVVSARIPAFTIDHSVSSDLHNLGIPGFNRMTVGSFLEQMGAKKPTPGDRVEVIPSSEGVSASEGKQSAKEPIQNEIKFIGESNED